MATKTKFLIAKANFVDLTKALPFVEKEFDDIKKILDAVKLDVEVNEVTGNFRDIANKIKDAQFFHYCGHATEEIMLLKEGAEDQKKVPNEDFAALLKELSNVEYVFLNGCKTQNLGEILFTGESKIKAVISTSVNVNDQKAAKFAELFYSNLVAYQKKHTIGKAFELAHTLIRNSDYKLNELGSLQRDLEEDINEEMKDQRVDFEWKVEFNPRFNENELKNWTLIPPTFLERLKRTEGKKVLCIYSQKTDINHEILDAIKDVFIDLKKNYEIKLTVYTQTEIEPFSEEVVAEFDVCLVFLGKKFKVFWDEDKEIRELITKCLKQVKTAFLKLKFEKNYQGYLQEIMGCEIVNISMIPQENKHDELIDILLPIPDQASTFISSFCKVDLEKLVFPNLKKALLELNFGKQRKILEGDIETPEISIETFNLFYLSGSENCGQLLLIRRYITEVFEKDKEDRKKYIIDHRFAEKAPYFSSVSETIWYFLKSVVLNSDNEENILALPPELTCTLLKSKLKSYHYFLVIDNLQKLAIKAKPKKEAPMNQLQEGIKTFWKDFIDKMNSQGFSKETKKLFIILVDRSYNHEDKQLKEYEDLAHLDDWEEIEKTRGFFAKDLKPIEKVNAKILESWHLRTKKFLSNDKIYPSILVDHCEELLNEPFVEKVAHKICQIIQYKGDTSFITDLNK